jgi:hypothetical protein
MCVNSALGALTGTLPIDAFMEVYDRGRFHRQGPLAESSCRFSCSFDNSALIFSLFILLPNGSQSFVYRLSVAAPIWAIAAVYGYMATAVFGVPIYLLLKRRFVLSPLTCCVSGAFIACLPLLSLDLLIFLSGGQSGLGTPGFALLTILGAVGGFTFWAVAFPALNLYSQMPQVEVGDPSLGETAQSGTCALTSDSRDPRSVGLFFRPSTRGGSN